MDCISMDLEGDAVSMEDDEHGAHCSMTGASHDETDEITEDEQVCTYSKTSNTFSEQHWCVCMFYMYLPSLCSCHMMRPMSYLKMNKYARIARLQTRSLSSIGAYVCFTCTKHPSCAHVYCSTSVYACVTCT
jgi:hypothetical protein